MYPSFCWLRILPMTGSTIYILSDRIVTKHSLRFLPLDTISSILSFSIDPAAAVIQTCYILQQYYTINTVHGHVCDVILPIYKVPVSQEAAVLKHCPQSNG